ncbi:MAG: AraC family transcriptional regulator [Bacteroidetes bacterium]|nr:AraC family transcriptional regulator [Bacteroidota bacterium]
MHEHDHHIQPDHKKGVLKVLHYINQHLPDDLSLEVLAEVANYSPYHFQRIFQEAIRETPKQYVIRLRLEKAAHYLKIFPEMPVAEIAFNCGFSSPATFSRAFKSHYQVNAETFRTMPNSDLYSPDGEENKIEIPGLIEWVKQNPERQNQPEFSSGPTIKWVPGRKFACIPIVLNHPECISLAFRNLMKWAIPNELHRKESHFIGIWLDAPVFTSLEKCRYLAGIEIDAETMNYKGAELFSMDAGKYASLRMKGDLEATWNKIVSMNHNFIESMGFSLSELIGFEIFEECPAYKPYESIMKDVLLPVRPKG